MSVYTKENYSLSWSIILGDLVKVGWVVLKSRFNINPYCDLENSLYDLNNDNSKKKTHWFSIDENNVNFFTSKKSTLMKAGSLMVVLQKFTIY